MSETDDFVVEQYRALTMTPDKKRNLPACPWCEAPEGVICSRLAHRKKLRVPHMQRLLAAGLSRFDRVCYRMPNVRWLK